MTVPFSIELCTIKLPLTLWSILLKNNTFLCLGVLTEVYLRMHFGLYIMSTFFLDQITTSQVIFHRSNSGSSTLYPDQYKKLWGFQTFSGSCPSSHPKSKFLWSHTYGLDDEWSIHRYPVAKLKSVRSEE